MSLTDRQFWIDYWENKGNLVFDVKRKFLLHDEIQKIVLKNKPKNAIELGGFPGYFAVYLKKWYNIQSSLLDYVIHPKIIDNLLDTNGLREGDIEYLESDLWQYSPQIGYDFVLSVGLIEHFEDTADILEQHVKFMNKDAVLLINIPNFTGFNGWIQRTFDPDNYEKHNISCMNPGFLAQELSKSGLKEVESYYYGGFSIWLENYESKSVFFKAAFKIMWLVLKVLSKLIPLESKWFSPYINLKGRK
ncbi:class I SAM-dependent methyltransferase [Marinilongibacter aquaticus]|uniref:methyltransferase domain-containing protein n=1 Tax=Marinilongibacter aquaticus TaxID=2975157 RepID=UPI0021BDB6B0|nr:methyltransferase domain-containing protein [Marinilongibacter aquaticus]UBM58905.1 class I SAM-dependent methyltransferase [Marinilongibacter aquaticus]